MTTRLVESAVMRMLDRSKRVYVVTVFKEHAVQSAAGDREEWQPTGNLVYRLPNGEGVTPLADGSFMTARTKVRLRPIEAVAAAASRGRRHGAANPRAVAKPATTSRPRRPASDVFSWPGAWKDSLPQG